MIRNFCFLQKKFSFSFFNIKREATRYKNLQIVQNQQKKYEIWFEGKKMKTPSKKPLLSIL